MKVGIIDADLMDFGTRHPNLALMKIAGFYRDRGDEVRLIYHNYEEIKEFDKVFISKVFEFTFVPEWVLKENNIVMGGTGFFKDGGKNLPYEIEHHMPYYDLYLDYINEKISNGKKRKYYQDYLDYSIGFTTRGCFRKCSFCVNKKYDRAKRHSHVSEFYDKSRPYIYLWDDNILAYNNWEEVLDELEYIGRPFQFRQGIDLRLMNNKIAYRFNNCKWRGDFIFAFDHIDDKKIICSNIQLWRRYTTKNPKLYVLSGYDSQDECDIENVFERIRLLMIYGSLPYIMRYNEYKNSRYKGMYIQIARWCNQPQFYKKMSFREFCEKNQYYHPDKNTYCSAYRAMIEFEKEHPNIANKYFDLKYESLNIYNINYGVGQKYCNKPECDKCIKRNMAWDDIIEGKVEQEKVISMYILREVNIFCLNYCNAECRVKKIDVARYIIKILLNTMESKCIEFISNFKDNEELIIDEKNIDNIGNINEEKLMRFLTDNFVTYDEEYIVRELFNKYKITNDYEKRKFREMLKVLAICDLIYYSRNNINGYIKLTDVGIEFLKLDNYQRSHIFSILKYKIPTIRNILNL